MCGFNLREVGEQRREQVEEVLVSAWQASRLLWSGALSILYF